MGNDEIRVHPLSFPASEAVTLSPPATGDDMKTVDVTTETEIARPGSAIYEVTGRTTCPRTASSIAATACPVTGSRNSGSSSAKGSSTNRRSR